MKYTRFAECECGAHVLGVSVWDDDPEIYINWYAIEGYGEEPLWDRIKRAWELIVKGNHITHDIILTPKSATDFAEDLLEAVNVAKHAQPVDLKELEAKYREILKKDK